MVLRPISIPYNTRRINPTTFLIVHDDKYDEHPYIYAKIYDEPFLIVLFDTGCGPLAASSPTHQVTDLRLYLETVPVSCNDDVPLNPSFAPDGRQLQQRDYMILLTHCHYDHIGGMEAFNTTEDVILASGFDKYFASAKNRRHNSLCDEKGIRVPQYCVWHYLNHLETITRNIFPRYGRNHDLPVKLKALQTPGHTPDSLTVWDEVERTLYTGDLFYWRWCTLPNGRRFEQAIVFPPQGDFTDYKNSLILLETFILDEERKARDQADEKWMIKIACSHTTENACALEIVRRVSEFLAAIVKGEVPVKYRRQKQGETFAMWLSNHYSDLSLFAPERLRDQYFGNHE